jgi:hypothetical protein
MGNDPPRDARSASDFVVVSHEALFVPSSDVVCDACGCPVVAPVADADSDDAGSSGRGTYLWVRGGEATLEHVPLCAGCASAIGVTALARWEIEEEEG